MQSPKPGPGKRSRRAPHVRPSRPPHSSSADVTAAALPQPGSLSSVVIQVWLSGRRFSGRGEAGAALRGQLAGFVSSGAVALVTLPAAGGDEPWHGLKHLRAAAAAAGLVWFDLTSAAVDPATGVALRPAARHLLAGLLRRGWSIVLQGEAEMAWAFMRQLPLRLSLIRVGELQTQDTSKFPSLLSRVLRPGLTQTVTMCPA